MTVGITAVSSADYYLRSCAGDTETAGPAGPADYELEAIAAQGEPLGYWWHPGRAVLELHGDIDPHAASGEAFRTLVNEMRDPTRPKVWEADPTMAAGGAWRHPVLGSDLRHFRTTAQRMADWDARHPHGTPEERAKELVRAQQQKRQNRTAYDVTFSLPKSWSVLHAAWQREGRHVEAEQLIEAFRVGIEAAMRQAAAEFGMTRRGVSGPKIEGEATTTHERTPDLVSAVFMHHTSRDRDPQLHAHLMVLNRVLCADGVWRALHALPLMRSKHQLDATMLRVAEGEATRRLGITFAAGPGDKAREVVGVSKEVRDLFSARSRALGADAQELEDAYRALYPDRNLRPLIRWRMNQRANKKSRKAKPEQAPTREEDLARWEAQTAREFRQGLSTTVASVDTARVPRGESVVVEPLDEQRVIALALADIEARKANWYRSHLYKAIADRMPDMLAIEPARVPELISRLTDRAVAGRDVVTITAPAVGAPPGSLVDALTGRTVFDMGHKLRYTTSRHLAREDSLVARLDQRGAASVTDSTARNVLALRGLSPEQYDLGVTLLTSDRWMEVVDAPAGVGKSRVTAALSDASQQVFGYGLVGFTTAENAAQVLAAEGIERAHNIAAFLDYRARAAEEPVSPVEHARFAIPHRATVIVDEASMVDTATLQTLVGELEAAGAGRVVLMGDVQQVDAVDAGGVFALLAERAETRTLGTVRRFSQAWERDASTRIRVGDVSALHQYDTRARIHGDIDHDLLRDRVAKAFVRDYRSGRDTVLITSTADAAADVSSRVRELLVAAGAVESDGVDLHDQTVAGIGDLVQTRHNNRKLGPDGVFNRQVWEVVGTTSAGGLMVRRADSRRLPASRQGEVAAASAVASVVDAGPDGGEHRGTPHAPGPQALPSAPVFELPADYVSSRVELAYAGPVEAVQGRSTDTAHLLVDRTMGRSRAYPGLTRGRDGNWAWVELDSHRNELGQIVATETAVGRMADVIGDDDHAQAARTAIMRQLDRSTSLGHLGPQWQSLVSEERDAVHRVALRQVLERADAGAVLADEKSREVLRALRNAETAGLDPRGILEAAAEEGSVWSADSPAAVLRSRIDAAVAAAPHDPAGVPLTYLDRTPRGSDDRMAYAREVAAAMDDRVAVLGERVADDPPTWAVEQFGPVPDGVLDRLAWQGRAGVVEAYREQFGWEGRHSAIGPRPSRHEPERLWVWNRAADVLGMDAHARDLAGASGGELERRVAEWERALAVMPRNVDEDLRVASEEHLAVSDRIVDGYEAGLDVVDDEAALLAVEERLVVLEEIAEVRARLYDASEETRVRAGDARVELRRRDDDERDRTGRAHRDDPGPVEPDEPDEPEPADVWGDAEREAGPGSGPSIEGPDPEEVDVKALAVTFAWISEVAESVAGREVPEFGSRAWVELEDGDPVKAAAVTEAARRLWNVGEPLDRDAAEVTERLEGYEAGQLEWVGAAEYRVVERPAGDGEPARDLEATWSVAVPVDAAPSVDVEVLAAVGAWAAPYLEGDAPAFGSRAWAELSEGDSARGVAEARAAVAVWNLGDDLEVRRDRLAAHDQVESSHAVAQARLEHAEAVRAERARLEAEERRLEADRVREVERRRPGVSDEEHVLDGLHAAEVDARDEELPEPDREIARLYLQSQGVDVDELAAVPDRGASVVWPEVDALPEPAPQPEPASQPEPQPESEPQEVVVDRTGSDEVRRWLVREAHADEARREAQQRAEAEEEAARDAAERERADREAETAEAVVRAEEVEVPAPREPEREPQSGVVDARAARDAELAEQLRVARVAAAALDALRGEQEARAAEVAEQRARETAELAQPELERADD